MIRINLLSAREARRRGALRQQFWIAGFLLLAAIAGGAWFYDVQSRELLATHQELQRLESELAALDAVVKEVQQFEIRQENLKKKVEVIGQLHTTQRRPARLLDQVSQLLPDQVWLEQIRESGPNMSITGKSFDNVGIASFMENLERSPYFAAVGLVESKTEEVQKRQVKAFTITILLAVPKKVEADVS